MSCKAIERSAPLSPTREREGFGGEGDSTEMNQLPEAIAGRASPERYAHFNCAFAPSPLAPLPRWGRGADLRACVRVRSGRRSVTVICNRRSDPDAFRTVKCISLHIRRCVSMGFRRVEEPGRTRTKGGPFERSHIVGPTGKRHRIYEANYSSVSSPPVGQRL